jgi:hypothetical protein
MQKTAESRNRLDVESWERQFYITDNLIGECSPSVLLRFCFGSPSVLLRFSFGTPSVLLWYSFGYPSFVKPKPGSSPKDNQRSTERIINLSCWLMLQLIEQPELPNSVFQVS